VANHPIPIDGGGTPQPSEPTITVPWGDTITVEFKVEARLIHMQTPLLPAAFEPPIPMGHFYSGDLVGERTAQRVAATVKFIYMIEGSATVRTINVKVADAPKNGKKKPRSSSSSMATAWL
jgi:hypothetical protein